MFNIFVNFGDIKGESTEQGHKDWIGALSVSFQDTCQGAKRWGKGEGRLCVGDHEAGRYSEPEVI